MPVFGRWISAVATIRDYPAYVAHKSTIAAQQTVALVKQTKANITAMLTEAQENTDTEALVNAYSNLTQQEKQQCIDSGQLQRSLDELCKHESIITLETRRTELSTVENTVRAYLAAAQVLDIKQDRELLRGLLSTALRSIASASHYSRHLELDIEGTSFSHMQTLIEHIMFRCATVCSVTDYRLRQYAYMQEGMQLLNMLQQKISSLSANNLRTYIQTLVLLSQRDSEPIEHNEGDSSGGAVSILVAPDDTDAKAAEETYDSQHLVADAEHNELLNTIDIASVFNDYSINIHDLARFHPAIHVSDAPVELCCIENAYNIQSAIVNYDMLLMVQVFAAFAARREIYYEMQRMFNKPRESYINAIVQYARNRQLMRDRQAQAPTNLVTQLVQMRIAHAIRIYYMYNILEEFVHSTLAAGTVQISVTLSIQLHTIADISIASLHTHVLDSVVTTMSIQLTDYIYAAALICAANKQSNDNNEPPLRATDTALKEAIIEYAIHYIFDALILQCMAVRIKDMQAPEPGDGVDDPLTNPEAEALNAILSNINPLHIEQQSGAQLIKYLKGQAAQLLDSLPDAYFNNLVTHIKPLLVEKCISQLNNPDVNALPVQELLFLQGNRHSFSIHYTHHNIVYVMNLISYNLTPQKEDPFTVFAQIVNDTSVPMSQIFNSVLMNSAVFGGIYKMHTLYTLTHTVARKIYMHCIENTVASYRPAIVAGVVAVLFSSTQYILCPIHYIQYVVQTIAETIL